MTTMYPAKVNSPATILDGGINDAVTVISLVDSSVLPAAPNLAVIGTGEDAETILYETVNGNDLEDVTREFQGTAKAWDSGTAVARLFTAYDYDTLRTNLATHDPATTGIHGVSGTVVGTSDTQVFTNKTLISTTNVVEEIRTYVTTSTPIPTGGSLRNFLSLTALLENATFVTPSGTPVNGNKLIIRVKDNGTARILGWDAIYRAMEFALPTTTVISKTMYLGFIYNSADSKWDMVAINEEA